MSNMSPSGCEPAIDQARVEPHIFWAATLPNPQETLLEELAAARVRVLLPNSPYNDSFHELTEQTPLRDRMQLEQ